MMDVASRGSAGMVDVSQENNLSLSQRMLPFQFIIDLLSFFN